tara:strand:- start:20 stop:439 length:420 start_codon:yes stop_codon:yes gene_type:complete
VLNIPVTTSKGGINSNTIIFSDIPKGFISEAYSINRRNIVNTKKQRLTIKRNIFAMEKRSPAFTLLFGNTIASSYFSVAKADRTDTTDRIVPANPNWLGVYNLEITGEQETIISCAKKEPPKSRNISLTNELLLNRDEI